MRKGCDWPAMKQISMLLKDYRDIHGLGIAMIARIRRRHLPNLWLQNATRQIQINIHGISNNVLNIGYRLFALMISRLIHYDRFSDTDHFYETRRNFIVAERKARKWRKRAEMGFQISLIA